jgi:hypothetical protein
MSSLNKIELISNDKKEDYKKNNLSNNLNSSDDDYLEEELTHTKITTQRKQARCKQAWSKISKS